MKIVVSAPTGNIGARVVRLLLQAGVRPTLLARDPSKLDTETRNLVDIQQGTLADRSFVVNATKDADAFFLLVPTDYASEDPIGDMLQKGHIAATAISENGIGRTVFISSVGAEFRQGVGFIDGLGQTEDLLNASGGNVAHLRPGYFFTNLLMTLDTLKQGIIPTNMPLDKKMPWNDPRDIGEIVAARLLNSEWSGQSVQAIHGPTHLSYNDVATLVSESTGKTIQAVSITDEEERQALLAVGMPPAVADGFVQMSKGLRDVEPEDQRTIVTTTPTSLGAWAYEHLRGKL